LSDDTLGRRFKRWFWRPPRPHGEVITDRTVSALELFYDLVYVAVIAQAAHPLAEHVSARKCAEFAVVFALIWTAWVNGSLYLELHGRQDGRTRSFVFVQTGVLVLLAVFTADAAGDGGRGFAIVYAIFLAILTLLWNSVRLQDRHDHQEYVSASARYVALQGAAAIVILVSAFLRDDARLVVWTGVAIASVACFAVLGKTDIIARGMPPTDSLVERFGLFTIVVLGEFVFGVVDGLSTPGRDALTSTTGMIALAIGFGFWWLYFDLVGRRPPRHESGAITTWLLGHLPVTMSIAAAAAAMVSLIGHADDARAPASTAWLLSGAVALNLLALILTERTLADAERLAVVYRPLSLALVGGAAAALLVGWARPKPWLLASSLVAILVVLWSFAVSRFLAADAWAAEGSSEDY